MNPHKNRADHMLDLLQKNVAMPYEALAKELNTSTAYVYQVRKKLHRDGHMTKSENGLISLAGKGKSSPVEAQKEQQENPHIGMLQKRLKALYNAVTSMSSVNPNKTASIVTEIDELIIKVLTA